MFLKIFLFVTAFKFLLIPAYFSTDFEVHRNWLAITHNLPLSKWYYEERSEWTLDYPPFFAYFEYLLSQIAKFVDPNMLKITNFNYNSTETILFQRISVIFTDVIFALGTKICLNALPIKEKIQSQIGAGLILANVGLILVDHIHFQYNGFLFGILLLSIGCILNHCYLTSALLFAMLLNFKHIFLYIAPAFGIFFLKFYCECSKKPIVNFIKLVLIVLTCVAASFGPFVQHMSQIVKRLFPFKRGLTHAYWAPNIWAIYNFFDKCFAICSGKTSEGLAKGTGGLVQEFEHQIFMEITPLMTFLLTAIFMLPCLYKLLFITSDKDKFNDFIRSIVICSLTSFMFGWHVHEKAILMIIIPLSLLMITNVEDAIMGSFLMAVGHYSLHPLLFEPNLTLIKYPMILAYQFGITEGLQRIHPNFKISKFEILYYLGLILLILYQEIFQNIFFDLSKKLPFLPLMLTSVYCSLGIIYFYIIYYYKFLCITNTSEKKHQ